MSFFPDPQRRDDIRFIFFKRLSYSKRMSIMSAFFVGGLALQLFVDFWLGLILLGLATMLGLIRGYAAKPKINTKAEVWAQVTPDEYKKVKARQNELKRWDLDALDITNPLGFFVLAGLVGFGFFVWFNLLLSGKERLATYWAWDSVILFVPHWLTGVRSFLRKDQLIIKIDLLLKMIDYLKTPSDVQVLPMLSTVETEDGKKVPQDARLLLRFLNAPKYFMGVQVQISINTVEGRDYPYLYCVIILGDGAPLACLDLATLKTKYRLTFETTTSDDVFVLVIRQTTTKTSGYCTRRPACEGIVDAALGISREILARTPAG